SRQAAYSVVASQSIHCLSTVISGYYDVVLTLQQSSGLNDKTSPGNFYCMPSTKHFWHTT
ncbi:hypothetical protein OHF05_23590, partial [Escherichia coli]|uniref:hypothetical protein n=1 Tax=Escherichia coli TaxID=562 RepID=UPI0021E739CE